MMTNKQRLALSLLLAGGVGACANDRHHPEGSKPATAYSGAEADQTAVSDTARMAPAVPNQDFPSEPGNNSPVAHDGDRIASDVPGAVPSDGPPPPVVPIDEPSSSDGKIAADNTGVNKRDRAGNKLTPSDQGTSDRDLAITKRIRESVIDDDTLSFTAKNVKIMTVDGRVTLRGPVRNQDERRAIEKVAAAVAGAGQVSNELEVK